MDAKLFNDVIEAMTGVLKPGTQFIVIIHKPDADSVISSMDPNHTNHVLQRLASNPLPGQPHAKIFKPNSEN
jgi:hypothetical protein